MYHNEALQTLDTLVATAVEDASLEAPPAAPSISSTYLLGQSPTSEWAGHPGSIAAYSSGGWRFIAPVEGMTVFVRAAGCWATYRAGAWELGLVRGSSVMLGGQQVVGPRSAGIEGPSGGTTVDDSARAAIERILSAMRQHGLIDS